MKDLLECYWCHLRLASGILCASCHQHMVEIAVRALSEGRTVVMPEHCGEWQPLPGRAPA